MNQFNSAGIFLIKTLFDLYIFILMMRFVLYYLKADFYNPVTQFCLKMTNPVVFVFRKFIPNFKGIELASLFTLILITAVKVLLIFAISYKQFPGIVGLLVYSLGDIIKLLINIFFYGVIISIVISWIAPHSHSPLTYILNLITAPVLMPARRFIPPISGFDISPIPVLIGLQLIQMLLTENLLILGTKLLLSAP